MIGRWSGAVTPAFAGVHVSSKPSSDFDGALARCVHTLAGLVAYLLSVLYNHGYGSGIWIPYRQVPLRRTGCYDKEDHP